MIPFNNCDKLSMLQLLVIWEILKQLDCSENINESFKINYINRKHMKPMNINHKKKVSSKKCKNKFNTECILPMQQINIEDDIKCINEEKENIVKPIDLNVQKSLVDELEKEFTLSIQKSNTNNDTKCIKRKNEIISSQTFSLSQGINIVPVGTSGPQTTKIPVVIAEKNIEIPLESTFRLKNAALDIKNIKKDIYLTNSSLLPMYDKNNNSPSVNGKLFLEGFIRNKIDFSIAKDVHDSIINLDTECVIIYIPFKCTAILQYSSPPIFSKENTLDYISPIACEINKYTICETHTFLDKTPFNKDFPIEINFHTIKENMILSLSLTLLQEQDVAINHSADSI